eukprot:scaffold4543_cov350-Prasinococcus_capsulatus_cf.AAC.3
MGEVGEYPGEVGEYPGEAGEYPGEAGEYPGEVGLIIIMPAPPPAPNGLMARCEGPGEKAMPDIPKGE